MVRFPRFLLMSAACVIVCALSGCSLVPAYQRPDTPVPAQWSMPGAAPLAGAIPVESGWWRAYGDATLDALVGRALAHSDSLASAVATVDAARANAEKSGAPLYPALTLNGTFERGHSPSSGSGSAKQSLFAQASYEIDFWGMNAANARMAALLAGASEYDRDVVALTLTASVADTYFQVLSLRRRLALANTVADDAGRLLQLVLAQQAAGVATELQVQQQRNARATFQAAVPTLEQQLDQNLHLLAMLVGTVSAQLDVPDIALDAIAIPDVRPDLPSVVLETRPDIRAQEARLQAANESVGAARAAFFPNLVLTAQGGTSSRSLLRFLTDPVGAVGASLVAPLFEGGALTGQLHMSRATFDRNAADYRQTVVVAFQDVEDALSAAYEQGRAEAIDAEAADAAGKTATLARAEYVAGTVDFLTVLDAERTRYQAEDTREQARLARLQASVGVFRAFGGGVIAGVADGSLRGDQMARTADAAEAGSRTQRRESFAP
ncbi:hypothetical protein A6V36_14855 [Paraburkholderia ginsengiterrae]|uniref:Transporter n=2 Tax=Paraburkholderia ginsengiterrae TaxID=1462993 RepID=A0ABX2UKS3_9BURK|nr:hypothetical protein A6V36_14855 [Paraburkholderia ginsengiterrae]